MSAFLCCQQHIDLLVSAAFYNSRNYGPIRATRDTSPDTIGRMLYDANVKSVRTRYADADDLVYYEYDKHQHNPFNQPKAVEVLKAINGYEYQSCGAEDWLESKAHDFCECLRARYITNLPGYDDAPWEWKGKPAWQPARRKRPANVVPMPAR